MKKIIYTLAIGIQCIFLTAVLGACKEEEEAVRLQEVTPVFSWKGLSFQLESDTEWSITRFTNRIALTNFNRKCQILLSWNGNSGNGEKTDGILKIAEVGKQLQTIRLDKLSVKDIDGLYYNIQFQEGEREGMLILSK